MERLVAVAAVIKDGKEATGQQEALPPNKKEDSVKKTRSTRSRIKDEDKEVDGLKDPDKRLSIANSSPSLIHYSVLAPAFSPTMGDNGCLL